ncbi:MAG: hypothetical protein ACI8W7_001398 [Gammaproteobacteria bacterium]|jgi:hypothetical protein
MCCGFKRQIRSIEHGELCELDVLDGDFGAFSEPGCEQRRLSPKILSTCANHGAHARRTLALNADSSPPMIATLLLSWIIKPRQRAVYYDNRVTAND